MLSSTPTPQLDGQGEPLSAKSSNVCGAAARCRLRVEETDFEFDPNDVIEPCDSPVIDGATLEFVRTLPGGIPLYRTRSPE